MELLEQAGGLTDTLEGSLAGAINRLETASGSVYTPRHSATRFAGLAQLVEHLICNQGVTGSSPVAGTIQIRADGAGLNAKWRLGWTGQVRP